jgi:hypothetical protein
MHHHDLKQQQQEEEATPCRPLSTMAPTHEEIVGDFKPGSVTRIKLINFLTYSQVEFHPGPR